MHEAKKLLFRRDLPLQHRQIQAPLKSTRPELDLSSAVFCKSLAEICMSAARGAPRSRCISINFHTPCAHTRRDLIREGAKHNARVPHTPSHKHIGQSSKVLCLAGWLRLQTCRFGAASFIFGAGAADWRLLAPASLEECAFVEEKFLGGNTLSLESVERLD